MISYLIPVAFVDYENAWKKQKAQTLLLYKIQIFFFKFFHPKEAF